MRSFYNLKKKKKSNYSYIVEISAHACFKREHADEELDRFVLGKKGENPFRSGSLCGCYDSKDRFTGGAFVWGGSIIRGRVIKKRKIK